MRNVILLVLLSWVLSACGASTQVSKNFKLTASSEKALVLMGVKYRSANASFFRFYRYDPVSGKIRHEDHNFIDGGSSTTWVRAHFEALGIDPDTGRKLPSLQDYEVLAFDVSPGHWVLTSNSYGTLGHGQFGSVSTNYGQGTMGFQAQPGQVLYIGDIELMPRESGTQKGHGIRWLGMNLPAAQKRLKRLAKVDVEITEVEPDKVTFTCGQATNGLGMKTAGCRPMIVKWTNERIHSH